MSAFTQAKKRLELALARLEKAISSRDDLLKDDSAGQEELKENVDELRAECAELRAKLSASQKRYERMQSMVLDVYAGVDKTIGELDRLLERE